MSLVNDMLRDLDARRRDTPARGIGAEKLVPAAEQSPVTSKPTKPLWLWLALPVLLAAVVLGYLLLGRDNGQLPALVLSQPDEPAPQTQPAARPGSAADASPALDAAVGVELAEMSARLRELEAQNQALLRAQQHQAPAPLSGSSQPGAADSEQNAWQPRQWTPQADAEAEQATVAAGESGTIGQPASARLNPAEQVDQVDQAAAAEPSMTAPPPEPSGSTVRSPRAMSFSERDRLVVQQALEQWNGGQQLVALQALDAFTYDFPEAHQSREMLAKLLIQQGEPERAMQVVDLGLTIAPRRNGYKKVKARLLLNQGQAADAATLLSDNRPSVTDDVEYHDLLATGLLSSAAYEQAALSYQALLAIDSQPGRWWYGLAASLDAQGQSRQAAQAYEQALRREDLGAALRQGSQQRLQAIRLALP